MATYISSNSDGFLTYINEPSTEETLFKNIKDTYPEAELNEIFNSIDGEDVSETLSITLGVNCESVRIEKAVIKSKVLYLQAWCKPSLDMGTNGRIEFVINGLTPSLKQDSRVGLGFIRPDEVYMGYMGAITDSGFTVCCRKQSSVGWAMATDVDFTFIIPIE